MKQGLLAIAFAMSALVSATAQAADKSENKYIEWKKNQPPVVCVFDFLGRMGPIYGIAKELKLLSKLDGLKFEVEAYTSERVASEDFISGKCSGLVATGLRTRQFNDFAGSIEAIGAATDYDIMRLALEDLQDPKFSPLLQNENYAIAGIIPVGKLFFFVNDRKINSLGAAAGKRVASMDYDKAQAKLIARAGASPVSSDVARFGSQFNNNAVDVIVAPAYAYKALELYRGLGKKGAVIDFPLSVLTYQIVVNKERFSEKEIQRIRALAHTKVDMAINAAINVERDIPPEKWMLLDDKAKAEYVVAMRDARVALRDEGVYDKNMLKLLRLKRCEVNPTDAECTLKEE